jgi:serine/threonine protein kinase
LRLNQALEGTTGTFDIGEKLGEGAFGVTHVARRREDGLECVVKTLKLEKLTDWKAVELFEREANVLRQLQHPGIPRYVDSFPLGGREAPRGLVLVQELVRGRSLAEVMRGDTRLAPETMRSWLAQLLDVLAYLHGLAPPVIHRDVSPKNVLLRDDGRAFLIDFGTVQAAVRAGSIATTSAGTFGYAPMEQFMGRAFPASDLYGLAMTYVAVATGSEPEELPLDGVRLDVRRAVPNEDARLVLLLDAMTEPDPRARLGSAKDARERLAPLLPVRAPAPKAAPAPVVPAVAPAPAALGITGEDRAAIVQWRTNDHARRPRTRGELHRIGFGTVDLEGDAASEAR